ncbi:DUF3188 domain-containing protein [Lentzea sp. NEAU-D7]|uniref:DUF3188 domain-containing protein n=1 Tax=Lentzea sp. NEAU-D7 TaxID=2994667 RepID=UPI00224B5501|nr:DUF3188 domain-containing protein [Lentzea sp. NEAU-D7]MCX2948822.1 DUF3188 domain-containing protein [Lentzea sp. NEAU-D7]
MEKKLRWIAPSLVLLAVISILVTTATDESPLSAVLVVLAIGLLVAGYALRYRDRKRLIYQRDDDH